MRKHQMRMTCKICKKTFRFISDDGFNWHPAKKTCGHQLECFEIGTITIPGSIAKILHETMVFQGA